MNSKHINLWGREFDLFVSYQNYPGETITDGQKDAYHGIEGADFSTSLGETKRFIMENNAKDLNGMSLENVFRYVMPKVIVIPQSVKPGVFAILFDYKFDMEHGLALVFENYKLKDVGPEDIIL